MKKILSILLIIWIVLPFSIINVSADSNKGYFVVTAYYSPLPGQEYYLTGDYESEKRLNWQWIAWASWKSVFSWMLAAPKNYKFWTKIYLEWLWIWEVSDRGWAIVNAGNRGYSYDRIDVWMWYGDVWLKRALYWGKRTIKWHFVSSDSNVTLDYNKIASPSWATNWLSKISSIFTMWLWKWSNIESVKKLQQILTETGLYNWIINWIYNSEVIDIIYDFQIENSLIENWSTYWAWYWWKSTRTLFLKKYLNWEFDAVIDIVDEVREEIIEIDLSIFDSAANSYNKVIKLQKLLIELDLYNWKLTWIYKDIIDSIYDYQLTKSIVAWIYSPGAWTFWPKTRASLKETYIKFSDDKENIRLEKIRIEEEKIEQENRKKELEKKYKNLEELSLKKAETIMKNIGTPKFGEISHWVRELQVTLKQLGYFNNKDTAIYWKITKESIISYQIDKKLINSSNDLWAWLIWPKTRESIKHDLKEQFLKEIVKLEEFNTNELASIEINKI